MKGIENITVKVTTRTPEYFESTGSDENIHLTKNNDSRP